ncbi:hypothetical protein B566_EDAN010474 [Ephemera danica]|nr:hypothetical protein B566_EDAN010474 [Ephemera danica]
MASSLTAALILTFLLTLAEGQQRYDYKQALNLSLLFFEAQRAGHLPADNRVPWRGDSCTQDRGDNGEDLTGGYFTQGTTATFIFPNAAATTLLAWGLLDFEDAYLSADLRIRVREAIQWGADHLVKCHTSAEELYVFLGDPLYWGRPEDISSPRYAAKISHNKPGSEVAAEAAAALAASSIVLRSMRETYKHHARQLYEFAKNYRGDYQFAVPNVTGYYKSWSGDEDELIWAAIWLYRATTERRYLNEAEQFYEQFNLKSRFPIAFSWDEKTPGVDLLLYKLTLNNKYKTVIKTFCDKVTDPAFKRTPKGLYNPGYGIAPLRYALNVAFICLNFGEILVGIGENTINPYQNFAVTQLNYALGDTERSYVVGFGSVYPKYPYHVAASCNPSPATCNWEDMSKETPNPNEILGALVGGPETGDDYSDTRHWQDNAVAVDHNSALQSTTAGIISIIEQGRL